MVVLKLQFIFEDSIKCLDNASEILQIPSLPIKVFMLQQDVINHYEYAIYHYFKCDLNEGFLQNSSLGSPYQKWMKFTNDDFDLLHYSIHTLLKYTSRLWHETELIYRLSKRNLDSIKEDSNRYTGLLCNINYQSKKIGICVNDNNILHLSSIALEGIKQDNGHWSSIKTTQIEIEDRSVIKDIISEAEIEIEALNNLKNQYSNRCRSYLSNHDPLQEFDNLHASSYI